MAARMRSEADRLQQEQADTQQRPEQQSRPATSTQVLWGGVPCPLGIYTVVAAKASRRAAISRDSGQLGDLPKGSFVNVTDVKYLDGEQGFNNRVRAQLSDGSWITLVNTATNNVHAVPITPGLLARGNREQGRLLLAVALCPAI